MKGIKRASAFGVLLCLGVLLFQNCSLKGAPKESAQSSSSSNNTNANTDPVCGFGEILHQGQCYVQYISCTAGGGSGQQEFINGSYGACRLTTCPTGNHIENNICVSNTRSCTVANGAGQQSWNGSGYGACTATACNANYRLYNNACAGPIQNVYRYFAARYTYYWSTSASDPGASPRAYQGLAFSIYGASQPGATTPLYRCEWSNGNAPRVAAAHTNCAVPELNLLGGYGLNPSTAILGYVAAAAQPGAADKPLYYCELQPIIVDSFLITTNLGECNGNPAAVLGYVF